jgi:DNA helicase HerA-like ATPase
LSSPLETQLEEHRSLRRQLEQAVLQRASSLDGRAFVLQAPVEGLDLQVGGYAVVETAGGERLGQIVSLEHSTTEGPDVAALDGQVHSKVHIRAVAGRGVVLDGRGGPFHDAPLRPARADEVGEWLAATRPDRASLEVGTLALADGVPFALDAGGFDRHTFLCGQSGSGKTYALGTVLERLLLETTLRIVVLDPNSDYARLAETRPDAPPAIAERYSEAAAGIAVRRGGAKGGERLRLRAAELEPALQAALLRLDPVADREEYASLLDVLGESAATGAAAALDGLATSERPGARALALRLRALGITSWRIWARDDPGSLLDDLAPGGPRCVVVDLGSLETAQEQALAAEATLAALWRRRNEREPLLLVIDEAHNVCPAEPEDLVTGLATEHAVRIAGEGRKFGIYMLVATQRPQKVHENVVSQCDNLALMRMNSLADLAYMSEVFSFVPRSLLERATAFRQGESLVAGKLVSHPTYGRFGPRYAEEGGADVPATWAEARPVA